MTSSVAHFGHSSRECDHFNCDLPATVDCVLTQSFDRREEESHILGVRYISINVLIFPR